MLNYPFSTHTVSKNVLFDCGLSVTQTKFLLRHSSALYSFNKQFKKMKIHLEIWQCTETTYLHLPSQLCTTFCSVLTNSNSILFMPSQL